MSFFKNNLSLAAVVLAAGKGTRMKSTLPKVLHMVGGKTMLARVIDVLHQIDIADMCLVLGSDLKSFDEFLSVHPLLNVCEQRQQNGTGGALAAAAYSFQNISPLPYAPGQLLRGQAFNREYALVCFGDTPALDPFTLKDFLTSCIKQKPDLAAIGMNHEQPFGYGRMILNDKGYIAQIIEEKDATDQQKKIKLCNTGVLLARVQFIFDLLRHINTNNQQKEYMLTDCFKLAAQKGRPALLYATDNFQQFNGVNDREQLVAVEQYILSRK